MVGALGTELDAELVVVVELVGRRETVRWVAEGLRRSYKSRVGVDLKRTSNSLRVGWSLQITIGCSCSFINRKQKQEEKERKIIRCVCVCSPILEESAGGSHTDQAR